MKSLLLNTKVQVFIKGLMMAVGGGIVAIIAPSIQDGSFVFDWTIIWHTAVASALSYIGKEIIMPAPKIVQIDPSKTSVVDSKTKQTIINAN